MTSPDDQHLLLACIAPRPLDVACAAEDFSADPHGEFLSAYHASEVYRLLGKKGLEPQTSPSVDEAIVKSDIGYRNRSGGHSVEMFDWRKCIDFAVYHLQSMKRSTD